MGNELQREMTTGVNMEHALVETVVLGPGKTRGGTGEVRKKKGATK